MKTQTNPAAVEQPTPPWLKNFIPAPSDPALLTLDDARTAFAGDWSVLKEVMKLAQKPDRPSVQS